MSCSFRCVVLTSTLNKDWNSAEVCLFQMPTRAYSHSQKANEIVPHHKRALTQSHRVSVPPNPPSLRLWTRRNHPPVRPAWNPCKYYRPRWTFPDRPTRLGRPMPNDVRLVPNPPIRALRRLRLHSRPIDQRLHRRLNPNPPVPPRLQRPTLNYRIAMVVDKLYSEWTAYPSLLFIENNLRVSIG
jgi:hypothetical protein